MTKYLQLARITAWPAYSLTFVISFAVGSYVGTSWTSAWIGFLALFSFAGFAFALNFYSDRDTDRYHDGIQKDFDLRRQPMVTGKVTERECKAFCWAALLIAIVLGFLVSSIFGLLVILACFAGGILYSHPKIRLKAKPIGDIICISLLGVLIPSAGYVLGADILPTPLIMLLWFLVTATGYTASVVSDYEFDLKAGLRTSAVFFGPVKALKLMVVGCLLSIVVAFFIFDASHLYPIGTRYFMVFIVAGLIFLTALLWRSLRSPRMRLTVLSSRKRWVFMAPGAASLAFLCYAFFKIFGIIHLPGDPFGVL